MSTPVDVRPTVTVRRDRADLAWTGGITDSRPAQPGPLVNRQVRSSIAADLERLRSCLEDAADG